MRLAGFILRNMETILGEWEAFAMTLLPAATGMTSLALRDDAKQILEAVAKDLSTPLTKEAQAEKSKGRAPKLIDLLMGQKSRLGICWYPLLRIGSGCVCGSP